VWTRVPLLRTRQNNASGGTEEGSGVMTPLSNGGSMPLTSPLSCYRPFCKEVVHSIVTDILPDPLSVEEDKWRWRVKSPHPHPRVLPDHHVKIGLRRSWASGFAGAVQPLPLMTSHVIPVNTALFHILSSSAAAEMYPWAVRCNRNRGTQCSASTETN
jgi:hypothetical protein